MRDALRVVLQREHLRRTLRIAVVVGLVLMVIDQLDVILGGETSALVWVKLALSFCVPFVVSNLGLLAGTRAEAARREAA
jgi:hypothetical protein